MNDVIHKLNLRLPMHVVEEAKSQAAALGVSLNAYILFAISEQVKRARQDLVVVPAPASKPKPKPRPPTRPSAMPESSHFQFVVGGDPAYSAGLA
ncbi:toxin-antitoxin system HicB family antitoxin [Xanthomonas campestris pv. raphani]|nr:toxin-antitoxin system HicB family antitoxin [Xanthomonas campestris pv. raphani]QLC69872.1 toxin-antitoxin system HicB family antitoxin [Xanthomonas campestris pv. raphani]WDJ20097.1 toxin-antitoxin system HicB family antitoxin [Xanthomonas campestris pv. raphani]